MENGRESGPNSGGCHIFHMQFITKNKREIFLFQLSYSMPSTISLWRGISTASIGLTALETVQLPKLSFPYDALEPVMDKETVQLHHLGHHQTYVNSYNKALEEFHEAKGNLPKQLHIFNQVRFNAGGHVNHCLFWENLKPFSSANEQNLAAGKILIANCASW